MVIFQPQHISQLRTVQDVSTLGRWIALLSRNLQLPATALALEMPRPGVGIMTVTTNQPGAGYLFYFQLQKGVQIAPQKTLKSTFVLVASQEQQTQLMPQLKAGLKDQKFVKKLRSLRNQANLYDTIINQFPTGLTTTPTSLVWPNEKLVDKNQPELDLPLVIQTETSSEQALRNRDPGVGLTSPAHALKAAEGPDSAPHNYFASSDFSDPTPALKPNEETTTPTARVIEDETEYLLRYYGPEVEQGAIPTFPETKYFLRAIPEPFLVLRRFGDYLDRSWPELKTPSSRPVPLVEQEPVQVAASELSPVIEPVVVVPEPSPGAMPELTAAVEDSLLTEQQFVLTPPLVEEQLGEQELVIAPQTAPALAETGLEFYDFVPPSNGLIPTPALLSWSELSEFASTAPEAISFWDQDSEHLFDPNAFTDEDLAWLRNEQPDPSLGMSMLPAFDDGFSGLIDLGSGLKYLERDWPGNSVDVLVGAKPFSAGELSDLQLVFDQTDFDQNTLKLRFDSAPVNTPDPAAQSEALPDPTLVAEQELVAPAEPLLEPEPEQAPAAISEPVLASEQTLLIEPTSPMIDHEQWVYWEPEPTGLVPEVDFAVPTTGHNDHLALSNNRTGLNILVILTPGTNPAQTTALNQWLTRLNDQHNYCLTIENQPGPTRFTRAQVRTADLVLYTPKAKRLRRFSQSLCYPVEHARLSTHPLACILAGLAAVAQNPKRRWTPWGPRNRDQANGPLLLSRS